MLRLGPLQGSLPRSSFIQLAQCYGSFYPIYNYIARVNNADAFDKEVPDS